MYNTKSTPLPEPDPLAIEVFIGWTQRPQYVDAELVEKITAAVTSCGELPSAEVIRILAGVGVHIHQRVRGKAADGEMAEVLGWAAIQHDRRSKGVNWFDGTDGNGRSVPGEVLRHSIWVLDVSWIRRDEVDIAGYLGRLAPTIRRALHLSPDFRPYWSARQGVPEPPTVTPAPMGETLSSRPLPPIPKKRRKRRTRPKGPRVQVPEQPVSHPVATEPANPRKKRSYQKGHFRPVDISTEEERATRRQTGLRPLMEGAKISNVLALAEKAGRPEKAFYRYWNGVTKKLTVGLRNDLAGALNVDPDQIPI